MIVPKALIRVLVGLAWIAALASGPAIHAAAEGGAPVQIRETEVGWVYADPAGKTLYTFRLDEGTPGKSRCTNARHTVQNGRQFGKLPIPAAATRKTCAAKRPPFVAGADDRPSGDWTLITRDDGVKQWAYKGSPVYTSTKDRAAGQVNGEVGTANATFWFPVLAPQALPPGFTLIRRAEGLVIGTSDRRPTYVRSGGGAGRPELLEPMAAPGFGKLTGKWSIIEASGIRQYAFAGKPLFALPEGYGDADAAALGGWKTAIYRPAAKIPAQFRTRTTLVGKVFTTDKGMTLYSFSCMESEVPDFLSCDDPGDAAAYMSALCGDGKECARRWRLYRPAANAKPSGQFTIEEVTELPFLDPAGVTAPDGVAKVKAWAYRGKPLYTYVEDEKPGDTFGDWINYFARSWFDAVLVPGPGIY